LTEAIAWTACHNPETSCFLDQTTAPAWRYAERWGKLAIGFRSFGSRRSGRLPTIQGSV